MNKSLLKENETKLLEEQKRILDLLKRDTEPDPEIPGGHKPKFEDVGREEGENASEVEQLGNEFSITEDLENRLKKVGAALLRIKNGTYGKCSVGGEDIEEPRLRAEPAAETCIRHAK